MLNRQHPHNDALATALRDALHEREWSKLEKLMEAREDESLRKIIKNLIKVIPNSVKAVHRAPQEVLEQIEATERENQYVRVDLKSGLSLRTFPSRQQYRNIISVFVTSCLPSLLQKITKRSTTSPFGSTPETNL